MTFVKEDKSAAAMDKVCRFLAKIAELLDEDIMHYEELAPLVVEVFQAAVSDHTTVNAQAVGYRYPQKAGFLEALDLLTDYGAKFFRLNFEKIVTIVSLPMKENQLSVAESGLLRQIVMNLTYDLQSRILRSRQTATDIIGVVVHALVNQN